MLECALPILLLMSGASLISFLLASFWKQLKVDEVVVENEGLTTTNKKLEQEYSSLIAYSNALHREKEQLITSQKDLSDEAISLRNSNSLLQEEHLNITDEFDTFKESVRHSVKNSNKSQKTISVASNVDTIWEKKYKELQLETSELKNAIEALKNTTPAIIVESPNTIDIEKLSEENINLEKEIEVLKLSLNDYKGRYQQYVKDYHEMKVKVEQLEEVKSKLQEVQSGTGLAELNLLRSENHKLRLELSDFKAQTPTEQNTILSDYEESDVLQRIENRKNKIPFNKIGISTIEEKDNLVQLKGLGPFVEKKMNAIGIYTFQQIVQLDPKDQEKLNILLELPKNKFQKDEWVRQAKKIVDSKTSASSTKKKDDKKK